MSATDYNQEYAALYADFEKGYQEGLNKIKPSVGNMHQLSAMDREKEQRVKQALSQVSKEKLISSADNLLENQHHAVAKLGEELAVSTYDLDFMVADTLQRIDASENPETEYRDWVMAEQKIERDIYAGGTTAAEIDARNMFISFMDIRETEMKRVMDLYSAAALHGQGFYKEEAQKKLAFMTFKLSELRRLRTKMSQTKAHADAEKQKDNRGNEYIKDKVGDELENSLVDVNVFHPVSQNDEEAQQKVNNLRRNSRAAMRLLIMGYRYGKNRAEIEDIEDENLIENQIIDNQVIDEREAYRPRVKRYQGMTVERFHQLQQIQMQNQH